MGGKGGRATSLSGLGEAEFIWMEWRLSVTAPCGGGIFPNLDCLQSRDHTDRDRMDVDRVERERLRSRLSASAFVAVRPSRL